MVCSGGCRAVHSTCVTTAGKKVERKEKETKADFKAMTRVGTGAATYLVLPQPENHKDKEDDCFLVTFFSFSWVSIKSDQNLICS